MAEENGLASCRVIWICGDDAGSEENSVARGVAGVRAVEKGGTASPARSLYFESLYFESLDIELGSWPLI